MVLTRLDHQKLVGDHDLQRLKQVLVVQAGHAGQQPVGDGSASDRGDGKHMLGTLGYPS